MVSAHSEQQSLNELDRKVKHHKAQIRLHREALGQVKARYVAQLDKLGITYAETNGHGENIKPHH